MVSGAECMLSYRGTNGPDRRGDVRLSNNRDSRGILEKLGDFLWVFLKA